VLLLICARLVHAIWDRGFDPDQLAIPLMTALGDLLGTVALVACFTVVGEGHGIYACLHVSA